MQDFIKELLSFGKIMEGKGYHAIHTLIGDDTGDTASNIMDYLEIKKGAASWLDLQEKPAARKEIFPIFTSMSVQENKPGDPLTEHGFTIDYNANRGFHVTGIWMWRSYSDSTFTAVDVDLGINLGRDCIPTFKKMNAFLDKADQTRRRNRQVTLSLTTNVRSVMSRGQVIR
jgi:hypothetical protein